MKTKDLLIVSLVPLAGLLIPVVGNLVSAEWNWTGSDFLVGWLLLTGTTLAYRLLMTRSAANLPYRLGATLAVASGFLLTWVTLAVAIIGADNPANALYFGVMALGVAGTGLARMQPTGLARTSFAMALATFVVPIVGWFLQPDDFSPGVVPVFVLNACFALLFTGAGLLFLRAASANGSRG